VNRTIEDVSSIAGDEPPAAPAIVLVTSGTQPAALVLPVPVELGRTIRAAGQTHAVDDDRMSYEHARVTLDRGIWVIEDRNSRNGTFVQGERVAGVARRQGDVVLRLGHSVFILVADGRGQGGDSPADQVVGPELARAYDLVRRHAASPALLIQGESGTGKERAARLYHDAGPRSAGPFVPVNCAAIPEGVAEALLFGSRKGAFTDAIDAAGQFQQAHGGTLFLDEIADLDLAVQAKLLRAIEAREVVAVGATTRTPVHLGIVAASHRDLRRAVAERRFRDDLYFRIAVATVQMPPLRARKVDLARLVQREVAAVRRTLAPHARLIEACCVRPWPGNIRELLSAVRRAAGDALAAGRDVVRADDLPAEAGLAIEDDEADDTAVERPRVSAAAIDKAAVIAALERANQVKSVAARALGLHRTQLLRLIARYGLGKPGDPP
jgi:transcriptional regulator with PAS, ATPase and Fis domain